jgi:hypothetical protein
MNKKGIYALILTVLFLSLSVTIALAASKGYHGITTVTYNNRIVDGGSCCWNGGYTDTTNPGNSMDIFGLNVWTTYVSCNNAIQYNTWISYTVGSNPWLYQYGVTRISDGMAQSKVTCPSGQTRRLVNYIQHYWQDSGYAGDGGTINLSVVN